MSVSLKQLKCTEYNKKFLNRVPGQRKIIKIEDEAVHFGNMLQCMIAVNDALFNKWRLFQSKRIKNDPGVKDENNEQLTSDDPTVNIRFKPKVDKSNYERIEVRIQRTISTHKYYCVCSSKNAITVVPEDARMQAFIKKKICIPAGNRCCRNHLAIHRFYDEDLTRLRVHSNSQVLALQRWQKWWKVSRLHVIPLSMIKLEIKVFLRNSFLFLQV